MHPTAMMNGKIFFDTYSKYFNQSKETKVIDIGAQDVNGSLREVCPSHFDYIGVDFQSGKGVDVILTDAYSLPFSDNSIDMIVSSSCFEHSEMFWLSFLEVMRILKPHGLFYLNAPSDGSVHRYPVDCWRFYPDSGAALVTWAKRNGFNPVLLESYTQVGGTWQDCVSIFLKDAAFTEEYVDRILNKKTDFENGYILGNDTRLNTVGLTQNERKIKSKTLKGLLDTFLKSKKMQK